MLMLRGCRDRRWGTYGWRIGILSVGRKWRNGAVEMALESVSSKTWVVLLLLRDGMVVHGGIKRMETARL